MIELKDDIKYSVWAVRKDAKPGWHREYKELEQWCKENCNEEYIVVVSSPIERIFVFDDETDALAFKLRWT